MRVTSREKSSGNLVKLNHHMRLRHVETQKLTDPPQTKMAKRGVGVNFRHFPCVGT